MTQTQKEKFEDLVRLIRAKHQIPPHRIVMNADNNLVSISRQCQSTGEYYSVVAEAGDIYHWLVKGRKIQDVFPELTSEQREFLISGTTPGEWNEMFGNEDEEE